MPNIEELNSAAACRLQDNDCKEARVLLKNALQLLTRTVMQEQFENDLIPEEVKMPSMDKEATSSIPHRATDLIQRDRSRTVIVAEIGTEGGRSTRFFFNRAFLVREYDMNEAQLTAMLLYNVALSFHIEGGNAGNLDLLKTALRLYNSALNANVENMGYRNVDLQRLVALALVNNMGSIHANFFDSTEHTSYFHFLRRILEAACWDNPLMSEEDFDFFYSDALIFVNGELRHVPPA